MLALVIGDEFMHWQGKYAIAGSFGDGEVPFLVLKGGSGGL